MGIDKQNIKYFIGTTDKDPLKYKCGETVTFTVKAYEQQNGTKIPFVCPMFKYILKKDNCNYTVEDTLECIDGTLTVKCTLDVPGFCYLNVFMCNEYGEIMQDCESFSGAAGADVHKIGQALEDPSDFDEFWAEKLSELRNIPVTVTQKVPREPVNDVSFVWDVKVTSIGVMPSSFLIAIPKDTLHGKKYPIHLSFSAYGVSDISTPSGESSIDIIANPHGIMNGQSPEYYEAMGRGLCKNFGFDKKQNESPETCYFKNMLLRDIQTLRYAMTLPEWDGNTIISHGGSMGAMRATALAALCNEYVTALEIAIPWHCDLGGPLKGRVRGWRPELSNGIRYFDTASFAKRLKCPVTVYAGLGDTVCRAVSECVLFNNIRSPKKITFSQGNDHGYQMREEESHTYDENWNNIK